MSAVQGQKLGRDEYKKKKELEELRKLGAAPAEVDDEGFIINPHIPQYMAEAPWYLSSGAPGLKHQRLTRRLSNLVQPNDVVKKGVINSDSERESSNDSPTKPNIKKRKRAKRWIAGSCANCGSQTHKTKECIERPRRKGAKFTNENIGKNEHIAIDNQKNYSWDAKRDRWQNFNIAQHQLIIQRHDKMDQYRRKKRAEELDRAIAEGSLIDNKNGTNDDKNNTNDNSNDNKKKEKLKKYREKRAKAKHGKKSKDRNKSKKKKKSDGSDGSTSQDGNSDDSDNDSNDSDSDSDSDSDVSDFGSDDDDLRDTGKVIQRFDSKKRQTVRNLRLREDLPKYLRNLGM